MDKIKWYKKNDNVFLLIVFVFPVGIYLMWKNSNYHKLIRILITCAVAYVLFVLIFSDVQVYDGSATLNNSSWTYKYSGTNTEAATFEFKSNGTFTYHTIMFGGMSNGGTWKDIGGNRIKLLNSDGTIQEILIISLTELKIGETIYTKQKF